MPLTNETGWLIENTCATTGSIMLYTTSNSISGSTALTWGNFAHQAYAQGIAVAAWANWRVCFEPPQRFPIEVGPEVEAPAFVREARAATKKARALLVQHLTPEQRKTYEEQAYFDVDVGGKTYRIRQGTHGNVRLLEPSPLIIPGERTVRETVSFCAQPNGVPAEDAMLAQKLMLETEERRFLEIANWTDLRTGRLMDKHALLAAP